ncbi:MAG: S41 family peptidase [Pseudomonadales bacterium]|jgi:carboxyl-terminal processing protease|nr:S41 family peptidase [Pseudomonadales bacterium]MCP5332717.1 S41 family peptidase [Pseudomonadales bacterium]HMU89906.1 S41 family peptidase [Pseudomonadales bacterium]HMW14333.1 S41 family peptidase [Pseudomonadales bacterium]HMW83077.1 S41 family peptidase [Pseudomonadales bacterium]
MAFKPHRPLLLLLLCAVVVRPMAAPSEPRDPLPLDDLRIFVEVFDRIRTAYVHEVDDRTLLRNAIKGMLNELDPHSSYLDAESFKELEVGTTGEFGGLGIELGVEDGFIKVITPIDDTPAQRGGIEAGDIILKIDERSMKGVDLSEGVKLMRGEVGSKVTLTIMREGEQQPRQFTLARDTIKLPSIKSRLLESGYGYLRIAQFQANTGTDLLKALEKLRKEAKPLRGLVLDLRNNPGGLLDAAVAVADAFLSDGLIVYTQGRLSDSRMTYGATPPNPAGEMPVVVLTNGGTASAAEIVAGALQDQHRAVIMGTSSFGKGSVQTILPLTEETGVKLTTALYYTPSGRSIQAEGIQPDIVVERARITRLKEDDRSIKEQDLAGHLLNGSHKNEPSSSRKKPAEQDELDGDYQLQEALNLLKGLAILNRPLKGG